MLFRSASEALYGGLFQDWQDNIRKSRPTAQIAPWLTNPQTLVQQAGGDIANSLDGLYGYMTDRLLQANLKNSVDMLDEVQVLLVDLRDAWASIGKKPAAPAAVPSAAAILASA